MHIRTSSYAVCAGAVLVTGCAEWPRFDHLPDDDGSFASDTPPGSLASVTWRTATEPEPDPGDLPTSDGHPEATLALGEGLLLTGALDGAGWSDEAVPERLTDEDCPGAEGTRSPLEHGDYLADVDFVIVDVPDGATLCASLMLGGTDAVGWDLVAFPVDACGIPGDPLVDGDGDVLGANLGGAGDGWGAAVPAGRYALLAAAYDPFVPDAELPYTLGVSMVARAPDGRPSACPLLPEEAP